MGTNICIKPTKATSWTKTLPLACANHFKHRNFWHHPNKTTINNKRSRSKLHAPNRQLISPQWNVLALQNILPQYCSCHRVWEFVVPLSFKSRSWLIHFCRIMWTWLSTSPTWHFREPSLNLQLNYNSDTQHLRLQMVSCW